MNKHSCFYIAPFENRTIGIVFNKILKSHQSVQLSIYFISRANHLSKGKLLLPEICHRQVMPGFTLNRFLCIPFSKRSTSRIDIGLGPTKLICPIITLNNCGSSSILVFRIKRPTLVTRGSFFILKIGPSASFKCSISFSQYNTFV